MPGQKQRTGTVNALEYGVGVVVRGWDGLFEFPYLGPNNIGLMVEGDLRAELLGSERHVGQLGGHIKTCTIQPAVDISGAYASGDLIGKGPLCLSNATRTPGGSGVIHGLTLVDLAKQDAAIDVLFFDSNLFRTTFTDNGALTVNDTELFHFLGGVKVTASAYHDFADNSCATMASIGLPFVLRPGQRDLWVVLVSRGTPTYVATTDFQLSVSILQD